MLLNIAIPTALFTRKENTNLTKKNKKKQQQQQQQQQLPSLMAILVDLLGTENADPVITIISWASLVTKKNDRYMLNDPKT